LGLRKDLCAYEIRHAFGTYGILNGVDIATLAELMGHSDTTMVSRVYGHRANQTQHLAAAVVKAAGTFGGAAGRDPKNTGNGNQLTEAGGGH
jgi:integrase